MTHDEVRVDLMCGKDSDGHWHGWFRINVDGGVLRRLGLHPD
jgi:hypothetical protein